VPAWEVVDSSDVREAQDRFDKLGRAILVSHFIDCFQSGQRPVLSAEHARHTLEVMIAAEESGRTGCAVEVESSFDFAGSMLGPQP
jgi:predicted dehydrogenase